MAIFNGKWAILSVVTGNYLSIDQSNGQIAATASSITSTEIFIDKHHYTRRSSNEL